MREPLTAPPAPIDVAFDVALTPMGSPRPRFSSVGGRIATHMPPDYVRHCQHFATVAAPWRPREIVTCPVGLDILAVFPRLVRDDTRLRGGVLATPGRRWHTNVPDVDNVAKVVLDSLGAWWSDDRIVAGLRVAKVVAAPLEKPRYFVRVRDVESWMRNRSSYEPD